MILTIDEINAVVSRHGIQQKAFWQEAAGGDMVPLTLAETNRILSMLDDSQRDEEACVYGIPKDPQGNPFDTKTCGRPAVYKAIGGNSWFCAEHAPEVQANDDSVYFDAEPLGKGAVIASKLNNEED